MKIKKGGRPHKKIKKDKIINIRCTSLEKKKFLDLKDNSQYNYLSDMIIDTVLNKKFKSNTSDNTAFNLIELGKYTFQINKIGANIYQILKQLNTKKYNYIDTKEVKNLTNYIKECTEEIESLKLKLEKIDI